MLSVPTQERLKKWLWFITLGVLALIVPPMLGADIILICCLGAVLLWPKIAILNKGSNFAIFAIAVGAPAIAYLHTSSIITGVSLFFLPLVQSLYDDVFHKEEIERSSFLNKYSTARTLDVIHQEEAKFQAILEEKCKKLSIPVTCVMYVDLFDKVTNENFFQFKKDFQRVYANSMKKQIFSIESKEEFMTKIKSHFCPSISASYSFKDGNKIIVRSQFLKHEKIKLTKKEIKAVILHELGHLSAKDSFMGPMSSVLKMIAIISGLSTLRFAGIMLSTLAFIVKNKYDKATEISADMYAVVHGQSQGLESFFRKVKAHEKELNVGNDTQKSWYEKATVFFTSFTEKHPSEEERITLLDICQQKQSLAQVQKRRQKVIQH